MPCTAPAWLCSGGRHLRAVSPSSRALIPDRQRSRPAMEKSGARRALVVGSGPAGLAAAIFLAQKRFNVEVFEKREDPREQELSAGPPKSIFYGLSGRGKSVLTAAGVSLPENVGETLGGMTKGGSMFGMRQGRTWLGANTISKTGNMLPEWTFIDRSGLVRHLTAETQRLHPNRIHLHFQRSIHSVNWDKKQAVFKAADGTAETFPYDLLIASDGRHSKCRQLYQQHDPCFTSFLQPNSRDYAAFSGITMPEDLAQDVVLRDAQGLHLRVWFGHSQDWFVMLGAASVTGASVMGYVSAQRSALAAVNSAEEYARVLAVQLPHMPASLQRLIPDAVAGSPKQDLGASGRVSSLVGPSFVMMGDAAHSVKPNLGQGCNAALFDAQFFGQMVDEAGGDLQGALQLFEERRHPETLALHQMDMLTDAWNGRNGNLHPTCLAWKFHNLLQLLLVKFRAMAHRPETQEVHSKMTPFFRCMTGGLSYQEAKAYWERDRNVFFCASAVLSAAALSWLASSICL